MVGANLSRCYGIERRGEIPEVVYPPRGEYDNLLFEFRLVDEAEVRLPDGKTGRWGDIKNALPEVSHFPEYDGTGLEIEVLRGAWECNPRQIWRHFERLTEKIGEFSSELHQRNLKVQRRNLQIKNLRDKLAAAKQR